MIIQPDDRSSLLRLHVHSVVNAICVLVLFLFLLLVTPKLINSDSASAVLLAADLLNHGGSLLSNDWFYVSDSLTIDGRIQVALFGVLLFGGTVNAFVLAAMAGALLAFFAQFLLARVLGSSRTNAVTAALVLLLGPSLIYQDIVIGLTVSVQIALLLVFVLALARYAFQSASTAWLVCALSVLLLFSVSSPKKAAVYLLLPAIVAMSASLVVAVVSHGNPKPNRVRLAVSIPALIAVTVMGYWWHAALLQGVEMNVKYASLDLVLGSAKILENLKTVTGLFSMFAGDGNSMLDSFSPPIVALALMTMFCMPLLRRHRTEFLVGQNGFVYMFSMAGIAGILVYLLTYEEIKLYYGIYYLLMPLAPLLAVSASFASDRDAGLAPAIIKASLLALLALGASTALWSTFTFPNNYYGIGKNQKATHQDLVTAIAWLRDQEVQRGYATYWDANAITLRTNGSLQVAPILVSRSRKLHRFYWLNEMERVDSFPVGEKWFIAIPVSRKRAQLPDSCLPADVETQVAGFRMYVYDSVRPGCLPEPKHRN